MQRRRFFSLYGRSAASLLTGGLSKAFAAPLALQNRGNVSAATVRVQVPRGNHRTFPSRPKRCRKTLCSADLGGGQRAQWKAADHARLSRNASDAQRGQVSAGQPENFMEKCMKKFRLLFALPCMLLGLLTQLAVAQNANSGVLQGIVSDSVGAVVPDVSVDILNDQTGILQSTKTNSDGLYAVTSVPLGQYTITFSKVGFDTYVRQGVLVFVGTARLDAQLKIGQVSEQVTVTGQPPLLETETSDQTVTIEASTVQALPVMGADWRGINGILPGVNAGTLQNASGQWSGFNGTQTATTAWVFNGQGAVLPFDYNPGQNFPPSDAVDEINASTSNFSAQYGNGASVFNMITKSGTNRFHGTVFEQFQNSALEARNYFAQSVTPLTWNEAGASIGGPFMKDKLFFFFTFMANPNSTTSPTYFTFPTDAMKKGDFSDPQFPTIYDPASLDYSSGKATRTALAGNQVTTIDPVAAAIQKFWPKPNNLGAGGNSLYNNYYAGVKNISDWQWWVYKVDYQVNDHNRLSFAGQLQPQDRESPDPRCPANCFPGILQDQAGEVTYTTTFNASMANEARAGYVRELTRFHSPTKGKGYPAALGLINAPADVFPLINVSGVVSSELDAGTDTVRAVGVGQYSDVLSLVKGKHILKIGGEYDRSYGNLSSWGDISAGNFFFNGIATRNPADSTSAGLGYADFLFGLPQSWNVTESVEDATHYSAAAAFVQDDYKVRKNLTLNLGLRWEYLGSWLVHDNSSSPFQNDFGVFDPTLLNPATGTNGAMVFGGQNGRNSVYDPNPYNFVPRVGFAWNPLPKWAVRGSYGMFDLARAGDGTETPFLGVASNTTGALTSPDNINPVFSLSPNEGYKQGYVQGPPKPISPTAGERTPQLLNGQNVSYEAKSIPTMYDQEIYLNVQREFSGDVLLSAGYVHTKGTHLGFERDINQVPEALLGPGNAQSQRPYPQFQSISGLLWDARSNYDALQLRAEKRLSHGLYFVANYTWSKILDTATTSGASGNLSGQDVYQRSYDTKANYGLSVLDIPNMINGMVTYQLPFGVGRRWLNTHGPLNAMFGGWQMASYFQLHGGKPFTPIVGTSNLSNSLAGSWFPNRVGNGKLSNPSVNEWFDVTAFQTPAPYTFGNSGRNILFGPSWKSVDANVGKSFPLKNSRLLGEGASVEGRVDVFDLFNHPNFGQPNANIGTSGAGIISSANTSRNLQLTCRLRF